MKGRVYLLHFSRPYKHAAHYIGWSRYLKRRLAHHKAGTGARLLQVIVEAGIDFELVRVWKGVDKHFERRLKNQKNTARLCPICAAEHAARDRARRALSRCQRSSRAKSMAA